MSSLVGKFFTKSNPPSFADTEQSLRQQWNLSGDMTVQKLDDNNDTFLFEFKQINDKEKVQQQGHYNVNGVIIVIKNQNSLDMIDFTVTTFSVNVYGLPSYLHNIDYFLELGLLVGDNNPVLLDIPSITKPRICYQVDIDLKKPLRPGLYIQENQFLQFQYRNLGYFCYNCGMIDHVQSNCDLKFPKECFLYDKSSTQVYGPWLRCGRLNSCPQMVLLKVPEIQNSVREVEKTLSYAHFFIEIEFYKVYFNNQKMETEPFITPMLTHRLHFPCSYLDTETESTTTTPSKAHEVLHREISENTPLACDCCEYIISPEAIEWMVEEMKYMRKHEFGCDDKWLTLKLQIHENYMLAPVDFETFQAVTDDGYCMLLINSKISDLIKKTVEEEKDLLSLSYWENQIREAILELGLTRYTHPINVSRRANQAMMMAVEMELSSSTGPKPADRSMVLGLERFKVLGPDMDRLNQCMICVEEMFLGEEATIMPCSHVFHSFCIDEWFQVGHKCPLCGFKLLSQN